ncbi:unnamed protein product [Hydatigera taeniaeformis]|uniref:PCI domain-containing protein n=1 Tax=Hydatigena taeniaeformis TaxID=6205 RepID=A0A158RDR3_HYDTA|nr:unnamed protein product [Hydatigera taeniaeformis]
MWQDLILIVCFIMSSSYLRSIPDVFVFEDLRDINNIKLLDPNSESSNLLNLFSFGTYGDHKSPSLPPLSVAQLRKLRQLTIISACEYRHHIPYDVLLKSLELTSLRELEDLIIDLIYADAIVGKLDQQKRMLVVESVIARDFKQDDFCIELNHTSFPHPQLPKLKTDLSSWSDRVNSSLEKLASNVTRATTLRSEWVENRARTSNNQNNINSKMQQEDNRMDVDSNMDVDDQLEIYLDDNGEPLLLPRPSTSTSLGGEKSRRNPLRVLQKGRKGEREKITCACCLTPSPPRVGATTERSKFTRSLSPICPVPMLPASATSQLNLSSTISFPVQSVETQTSLSPPERGRKRRGSSGQLMTSIKRKFSNLRRSLSSDRLLTRVKAEPVATHPESTWNFPMDENAPVKVNFIEKCDSGAYLIQFQRNTTTQPFGLFFHLDANGFYISRLANEQHIRACQNYLHVNDRVLAIQGVPSKFLSTEGIRGLLHGCHLVTIKVLPVSTSK